MTAVKWREFLGGNGLPYRKFLLFSLAFIVVSRVGLILATPQYLTHPDIAIYQSAGKLVLAGVNPYEYDEGKDVRSRLRAEMRIVNPSIAETQTMWDEYSAGNLPASTGMYALFEWLSGGSRLVWRLFFILGDIAILLGACAFLSAIRRPPTKLWDQAALFGLTCIYPSLLIGGTVFAEEKQFQTALQLFAAALLMGPAASRRRDILTGLTLSLSVLFKFFGAFLLPLFLVRYKERGVAPFVLASIAGLVPLAISFAVFGTGFVETMGARAGHNSSGLLVGAEMQSSPWRLLPGLDYAMRFWLRAAVTGVALLSVAWLSIRRRIELLKTSSALMVVFVCIWLTGADINRMNIAMMFATITLATLSLAAVRWTALSNLAVQLAGYPLLYLTMGRSISPPQAVLTLAFLVIYFIVLFRLPEQARRQKPGLAGAAS